MKDKFAMVGTPIPDFELPNSRGERISIQSFRGHQNVVVVLLRSILWPYCRAHVNRLANHYGEYQQLNTALYPILVDELSNAQQMEKKYAKSVFPIFYDPEERVAKLLHQEIVYLKFGRMPGLLVVDTKGIIRFAYYSDGMKDIPANDDVFEVLEAIEGKQLVRRPAENPNDATER